MIESGVSPQQHAGAAPGPVLQPVQAPVLHRATNSAPSGFRAVRPGLGTIPRRMVPDRRIPRCRGDWRSRVPSARRLRAVGHLGPAPCASGACRATVATDLWTACPQPYSSSLLTAGPSLRPLVTRVKDWRQTQALPAAIMLAARPLSLCATSESVADPCADACFRPGKASVSTQSADTIEARPNAAASRASVKTTASRWKAAVCSGSGTLTSVPSDSKLVFRGCSAPIARLAQRRTKRARMLTGCSARLSADLLTVLRRQNGGYVQDGSPRAPRTEQQLGRRPCAG